MRYYHSIFKPLHFDYGRMLWSINHIPYFGALLSICDHRGLGSLHTIAFCAFLRVLTDGKINRKQADVLFSILDMCSSGEISYSELAFWAGIIVAQKDHLEREFLYMNSWKIWVTFNEKGSDKLSTHQFRRSGLFFDFDYPTIYYMYREYSWEEDKPLEFERYRLYATSCIHFRNVRRANAKYLRYKKFKVELLELLHAALTKVLRENLYPAPTAILRAIKSIKIPPLEGQEMVYHWSDVFTLHWVRRAVNQQWQLMKLRILLMMQKSIVCSWICHTLCCGVCCTRYTWNACCICCCCGCCGICFIPKGDPEISEKPTAIKPVIIRRDLDLKKLEEIEKHKELFELKHVEYQNAENEWKAMERKKSCSIQ